MKNSYKLLFCILAASVAGVALFTFANSSLSASWRGDVFVAVTASLSLIGFAVRDYSHRPTPLTPPSHPLRPALPVSTRGTTRRFPNDGVGYAA